MLALELAETNRQENIESRDEYLTFVVIGGGPTGVEMAGAIAELTRHATSMEFRYVTPKCVKILLVEAGERLLANFPPELSAAAKTSLEMLGVEVRLASRVNDIDAHSVLVGEERIPTTTIIWAAGVKASRAAMWLNAEADNAGRVKVEPDMSIAGHPDIFVIGDTASIADADGKPVPGIAPAAKQQGQHVARVIRARLQGKAHPGPFKYKNFGTLATNRSQTRSGRFRLDPVERLSGMVPLVDRASLLPCWLPQPLHGRAHLAVELLDVRARSAADYRHRPRHRSPRFK